MENKKILVTGGSRGIGKAVVESFINDGHEVLTTCRDPKKFSFEHPLLRVEGLDISIKESILNFQKIVDEFEPDVLINNAGVTKDNLFLRMSDDDWVDVIETNLTGTFRVTKLVARGMLKRKWGRIINISSISGIMGNPGQTNYSASKAGMDAFTKSLAKELGSRNITVNSIAPGFIATEMTENILNDALVKKIPLGRVGKVQDVVPLVNFLSSEHSNYITGQTLVVDGGLFMK
tara:strand:- start:525 stop:1226 length:702 start_codon:yes stop_codon:yes gene_type:complete